MFSTSCHEARGNEGVTIQHRDGLSTRGNCHVLAHAEWKSYIWREYVTDRVPCTLCSHFSMAGMMAAPAGQRKRQRSRPPPGPQSMKHLAGVGIRQLVVEPCISGPCTPAGDGWSASALDGMRAVQGPGMLALPPECSCILRGSPIWLTSSPFELPKCHRGPGTRTGTWPNYAVFRVGFLSTKPRDLGPQDTQDNKPFALPMAPFLV